MSLATIPALPTQGSQSGASARRSAASILAGSADLLNSALANTPSQSHVQHEGLILSSALQPIPGRLVRRIRSGEFVEMRDLLSDNVALHEQLESIQGPLISAVTPAGLRPRVREVPSLISWVFCYLAYVAVRTNDEPTRDLITYCRLIIREALRHGGQGWQEYDRSFRAQAAIDTTLRWNGLLPDLQATTMLGQRAGGGSSCSLCRGVDHSTSQCALGPLQQPVVSHQAGTSGNTSTTNGGGRRDHPRFRPVCTSWNGGHCSYPGRCTFRHVCITCGQRHQARECKDTSQDSPYKRGLQSQTPFNSGSSAGR